MQRFDISKFLFVTVAALLVLGSVFIFALYSGASRNAVYRAVTGVVLFVNNSLKTASEEATTVLGTRPKHFLQPLRYVGAGVTLNEPDNDQGDLILLSGFFDDANELRLIMRDGAVVARWPVVFSDIFPDASHITKPPATDWNIDTHGALALPDGSVVFNFEYGGLVKLDRCGTVQWTVALQTHHSVERAEAGGFWVPGQRHHDEGAASPFPPFEPPFAEDVILRVSDDGVVLSEISVPKLFYDNDLEALLTATGEVRVVGKQWDQEIVHVNKIEELTSDIAGDFPMLSAGDLALSMRKYNLIMIVDPRTERVKWWRIGPWLRQHDPEFVAGGKLVVFNNDTYSVEFGKTLNLDDPESWSRSNIIVMDLNSGDYQLAFGRKPGQELLSVIRGKVDMTEKGHFLITEFEGGRVIEADTTGRKVWEYVNRYSADDAAEITEARLYSRDYFDVSDWICD